MKVDDDLVKQMADLAGLQIAGQELPRLKREMEQMIAWLDRLPPAAAAPVNKGSPAPAQRMRLRDDHPSSCLRRGQVEALAPCFADPYLVTPCAVPDQSSRYGGSSSETEQRLNRPGGRTECAAPNVAGTKEAGPGAPDQADVEPE